MKTNKTKKEVVKPVESFISDNGQRIEILSNGKTLTEKYASEIWGRNKHITNFLNLQR